MLRSAVRSSGLSRFVDVDRFVGDGDESIINWAWDAALYPFRLATSRTAVKVYLTIFLFLVTSFTLLSISTSAYGIFYYNYIPPISLERPIYLQYDAGQPPRADIPLSTNALISQQAYDISIILHMPRTPNNLAAGNFMLDLTLHTDLSRIEIPVLRSLGMNSSIPSSVLHRSRRPTILPYSSRLSTLSSSLLKLPLHLLSLHDTDSITLTIPMFEEVQFARGKDNIPSSAVLEVQSPSLSQSTTTTPHGSIVTSTTPHLQIYSARLTIQARFHGLRRLIYNHRILAFIIFTSLFYGTSISTLAMAWALITTALSHSQSERGKRKQLQLKREPSSDRRIKTEPTDDLLKSESDDHQVISDTPTTFPRSSSRTKPLRYTPTASQDSSQEPPIAQTDPQPETREGEAADDEEDESEDEWEQLQRLRERMMQQQQQALRERGAAAAAPGVHTDSGIGTSLESAGGGSGGIVRRRSQRGSSGGAGGNAGGGSGPGRSGSRGRTRE